MLARAAFEPYAASRFVLAHPDAFRRLGRIPYPALHRALVSATWAETWLRWPLRTLRLTDWITERFESVDPGGSRLGLTEQTQREYRRYRFFLDTPDLAVLMLNLDRPRFRRQALRAENEDVLVRERANGPGAIVVGFRIGPYPVISLALAARGNDVSMIVGGEPLAEIGQEIGELFAPRLSRRIRYISSLDRGVLARASSDLDAGRVVSTLLEMSPIKYAKTTPVRFLGWETEAAYGIPYLAAMTGRSIVPLVMTREHGPRFRMRFLEAIPAPSPARSSILQTTQVLWSALEQQVLTYPEQWIGWTRLRSHLGIDVTQPPAPRSGQPSSLSMR